MFALPCLPVRALDPNSRVSQYSHTVWRTQEGFFGGVPNVITQTADGYLWIGTQAGLFRFDGARFVPFKPPVGERLRNQQIFSLLGSRDGSLWIGTGESLACWTGGHLTQYLKVLGRFFAVHEGPHGEIWMTRTRSRDTSGPLCKVNGDDLNCYGQRTGISFRDAGALAQDREGNLWVAGAARLAHGKDNAFNVYAPPALKAGEELGGFTSLAIDVDGSLWAGITKSGPSLGLQHLVKGEWEGFHSAEIDGSTIPTTALLFDRNHSLWVGTTNQGIYRIHQGKADHFGAANGLSGDSINGFYEDHEGDIWVTTSKGVDKFRDMPVVTFSSSEGFAADLIDSVLASRDGTVWGGNREAFESIRDGVVASLRKGLPGHRVTSLLEDRTKTLWVGLDDKLFTHSHGRFAQITKSGAESTGAIRGLTEDTEGAVWAAPVANAGKLLRLSRGKRFEEVEIPENRRVVTIAANATGGISAGFTDGDLGEYTNGKWRIYPSRRTDTHARVYSVITTTNGNTFEATSAGLVGWRKGEPHSLSTDNGLPCNRIYSLIFDASKLLWLYSDCGLLGITDSEIQRWWIRPDSRVNVITLDVLDGAQPAPADFSPGASLSPDGKVWFANSTTLQELDPLHIPKNSLLPPVHIEEVIADGKEYALKPEARMPPGTREVEIHYTALSFVVPQRVKFRYMLEGWDTGWQEAGTRRQVFYTNLGPKAYKFRVVASNNDGVWNEEGATLGFSVAPTWYQTNWFRLSCVAAFCLLLWSIYRIRLHQLAKEFNTQVEVSVAERTRIARELHDTLLQSLHGLMFRFQAARNMLPRRPDEAMGALDSAINRTEQAIAESRDAITNLRGAPSGQDSIEKSLAAMGQELASSHQADNGSPVFSLTMEGQPRPLCLSVQDEARRIAHEVLTNAFRHAEAHRIEVEIRYDRLSLRLRFRDDGRGIDSEILKEGGRPGHWGLTGMRERAQQIGAKLDFWSEAGAGTEIQLAIPAAVAYERSRERARLGFLRRGGDRAQRS